MSSSGRSSGGGVTSFNGRAGVVVPTAGDYTAAMVGAVASFNGRTGVVVPAANDYGLSQISGAIELLATTGVGGFALVNGTPNIISWTAPNDGNLHRVNIFARLEITTVMVGGQTGVQVGTTQSILFAGAQTAKQAFLTTGITLDISVLPNETVVIQQNNALTSGAATLFAEIWGL